MKKMIAFLSLFIYCSVLYSQEYMLNKINAGWSDLGYSVPESPAFSMLGNNPDNILKPTSVRSIAVTFGSNYLSNGLTIPTNFALEISPLLFNSQASLYDFNRNKFWYRMRISIGTRIFDKGNYQLAEGIRFSIIDKTDLRSDSKLLNDIARRSKDYISAVNNAFDIYANGMSTEDYIKNRERFNKDSVFKKQILDAVLIKIMGNLSYSDSIIKIRNERKSELWNAPIWEVGMAALQQSPDSLLNHARLMKVGLWSTYGTGFGKYSQLLVGIRLEMQDSLSAWQPKLSIGTRYYYGKNELRGFIQGEYTDINKLNTATASAGIVFNIINGIWGQFALNFIYDFKGNLSFIPGFNIGLGTAEKKSL